MRISTICTGISSAPQVSEDRVVSVPVAKEPVFLSWMSPGDATTVDVEAPSLSVTVEQPVLTNADNKVEVTVRNSTSQPTESTVKLTAKARVPLETSPASAKNHRAGQRVCHRFV